MTDVSCTVVSSTFLSTQAYHCCLVFISKPSTELILHCVKSIDQVCFSRKFDFWKGEHLPGTKWIDWFQIEHKEINFHIIFTTSMQGIREAKETFFVIKLFQMHFSMNLSANDQAWRMTQSWLVVKSTVGSQGLLGHSHVSDKWEWMFY